MSQNNETLSHLFPILFSAFIANLCLSGCKWLIGLEKTEIIESDSQIEAIEATDISDTEHNLDSGDIAEDGESITICTKDSDCSNNDPCDGEEKCTNGICTSGTPLPDGQSCAIKSVVFGWCQNEVCIPNTCGTGVVDPGEECDDGNDNQTDGCKTNCKFSCHSSSECNDDNPCTTDLCLTEGNVRLCKFINNHDPCDDGNVCTTEDRCQDGTCQGGRTISCDDNNPCTDDSCDPISGCVHEPNAASCDDGNPCTSGDHCMDGSCVSGENFCPCEDDSDCEPHESRNPCDGQLVCSMGECVVDADSVPVCETPAGIECKINVCIPNDEPDDEGYRCDMQNLPDGTPCDDGNPCTLNDTCMDGECIGGSELNCDDGNQCTEDLCDPTTGCYHTVISGECSDGLFCTIRDKCDPNGQCSGEPRPCFDNEECTADFCDEVSNRCNFVNVKDRTPCGGGEGDLWCIDGKCVSVESGN